MTNKKVGRPQTLTNSQIKKVVKDFADYIAANDDPTIVGFTASYPPVEINKGKHFSINKDYVSDHEEFSELRKRAIEKQEAYLLQGSTKNRLNATVAIFRLKQPQHGYRDRFETDFTSSDGTMTPTVKIIDERQTKHDTNTK